MYKIGIIGSGTMARVHSNHWSKMNDVEIAGIASLDVDSLASLTAKTGAQAHTDIDALLSDGNIDVIDICIPTPLHKDVAIRAVAAGKHVFLEKPFARTLAECDAIIDAHQGSGVKLMVGHVVRFFPEYAAARDLVKAGGVGTVAAVRASRLSGHPRGWRDWYASPEMSGGVILDMIIHDFDWLRWTVGEVDRVFAVGMYGGAYTGKLDYGLVTLHFANGAIGHVAGSWAHPGGFRTQFEICGDGGMIDHDSKKAAPLNIAVRSETASGGGVSVPESPLSPTDDPYYKELRHFIDCIDSDTNPAVSLEDARAAVAIATAALESIETGRAIKPA
jgi:predicted dehydrogenase